MKRTLTLLAALLLAPLAPLHAAEADFDPRDFGARPDGQTICTEGIQKAIDACHAAGGGRVYLTNGCFLSGTLRFKDNVILLCS